MTTAYDVPPEDLIKKVAESLKKDDKFTPPEWAPYVKTGVHRENPPLEQDWWHIRVAAVLRKIYINSPVGINQLSAMFGGSRDRGSKPDKAVKGSRAIIRTSLQQLESAGYVTQLEKKGRIITPAGQAFIDNISHTVLQDAISKHPDLSKY